MSYNDKEESGEHLLNWLNRERVVIGETQRIYSFDQLKESRLLPNLLARISPSYFAGVAEREFDYKRYLLQIEKYLVEIEDLRLKRAHRQYLLEHEYMSQLIKLILFLIMRQELKQQFVSRILELEEGTQIYLMRELQKMQAHIENNVEIKEIYQKIEELEEENDYLYDRLKETQNRAQSLATTKTALREENEKLTQLQRDNNGERAAVMEQLNLHEVKDYLTVYKELQTERSQLLSTYSEVQTDVGHLQETNVEMQEKLVEDRLIIEHLNQELTKYRALCNQTKPTIVLHRPRKIDKQNISKEAPSTAQSVERLKRWQDLQHTTTSFKNGTGYDEQQEPLQGIMKDYSDDLQAKLQAMYAKIGTLNQEISTLREQNGSLAASNRRREEKIAMASREFNEFSLSYEFTISG